MRIFIPYLGAVLTLEEDWNFTVHREYRNDAFAKAAGITHEKTNKRPDWWIERYPEDEPTYISDVYAEQTPLTIPAGTQLSVERIYIRKGAVDYNSITFRVKESPFKSIERKRFWVKLDDANRLVVSMGSIMGNLLKSPKKT